MAKAYYGSRFSDNMTRTPEGFLICHNAAIARTGWQDYLANEIGLSGDEVIQVYRSEEEVFHPAAIASFEGKPLTDEHPNDWVKPDNVNGYIRGVSSNIRRGAGEDSDKVLADLVVYDPVLISEIENGKREISCGYECMYEPGEQGYLQKAIRGNHVAVVTQGRAGETVAIKDEKPKERRKKMAITKKGVMAKMFAAFAKDAEPEELEKAAEIMTEKEEDQSPPPPVSVDQDPVLGKIQEIADRLDAMEAKLAGGSTPQSELDQLEKDLAENEESVTIDPEAIEDEAGPVVPEEERPGNPIPGADRKVARLLLQQMKPVIASMKDAKERQRATDALKATIDQMLKKPAGGDGYRNILLAQQTINSQDKAPADDRQLGKTIAERYNPHYKKEV